MATGGYLVTAVTIRMYKQPAEVKNESRKANMWESNKSEAGGRVAAEASPVASNHQGKGWNAAASDKLFPPFSFPPDVAMGRRPVSPSGASPMLVSCCFEGFLLKVQRNICAD